MPQKTGNPLQRATERVTTKGHREPGGMGSVLLPRGETANRDGATPDLMSWLCTRWDQGFASKATAKRGFAPEGPSCPVARTWGPSPGAFLSSCGQEGEEHSISTLLHGGKGHAPSLTILEGMDVAKNPQPIVLPLGRHSQLLHRGAGLPRRRAWITSSTLSSPPTSPPAGNHLPKPNLASQGLEDQWRPREGRVDPPANPQAPVLGLTWGKSGKWRFFLRCLTAPPHQSSKTCRFAFPLYCGRREGAEWGSSSSIPSQAAACPPTCSFQGNACLVRLSLGGLLAR